MLQTSTTMNLPDIREGFFLSAHFPLFINNASEVG